MMEPGDLWVERLDREFKDRAPRVITHDRKSQPVFSAPGLAPYPVAMAFAAGRSGREMQEFVDRATEDQAQRFRDPALRIEDQDRDGVSAEVLYTSLGMSLFGLEDTALQAACFSAYNDWLAEFCSHNRNRFVGIALISLADVEQGAAELRRVAKAGLKGAMIWGAAPADKPFWHGMYDPFWSVAQELEMPLSLHVITGAAGSFERKGNPDKKPLKLKGATRVTRYMKLPLDAQASFTDMILGGVLMRFPQLKLVSAENDSGWIAHYMYRLDHAFEKFGVFVETKLDLKPSDYVRRQIWATFQDDPIGPLTWQYFGEDRFMWASDYPHTDSTFPHSREVIERDFASIPEAVKRKIVCDNAARLYQVSIG
jgi:predicted TIM-barrel fold metal-dependent hydrolase